MRTVGVPVTWPKTHIETLNRTLSDAMRAQGMTSGNLIPLMLQYSDNKAPAPSKRCTASSVVLSGVGGRLRCKIDLLMLPSTFQAQHWFS